jgi:two-component sensor histidine kinase
MTDRNSDHSPVTAHQRLDDHAIDRALALTARLFQRTFVPRLVILVLTMSLIAGGTSWLVGLEPPQALVVAVILIVLGLILAATMLSRRLAFATGSISEVCGAAIAHLSFGYLEGRISQPIDPIARPLAETFNHLLAEREMRERARESGDEKGNGQLAALASENASLREKLLAAGELEEREQRRRAPMLTVADDLAHIEDMVAVAARAPSDNSTGLFHQIVERSRSARRGIETALDIPARPIVAERALADRLRGRLVDFQRAEGISVAFEDFGVEELPPREVEDALDTIAGAALANVSAHAQARALHVQLHRARASIRLIVEDDGNGYDVANTPRGHGWQLIEELAITLGGSAVVQSRPGRGTRVEVSVLTQHPPGQGVTPTRSALTQEPRTADDPRSE